MDRLDTLTATTDQLQAEIDNLRKETSYLMVMGCCALVLILLLGAKVSKLLRT